MQGADSDLMSSETSHNIVFNVGLYFIDYCNTMQQVCILAMCSDSG